MRRGFMKVLALALTVLLLTAALPEAFAAGSVYNAGISPTCARMGHSWGSWDTVRKATCQQAGKKERVCSRCGEKESKSISRKDHSWGDWTVLSEPTDFSAGKKEHKCKSCGKTESTLIYPAGTLKTGDRGDAVVSLQEKLNLSSYPCGTADGIYGTATAIAVSDFEKAIGIEADGIAWPGVVTALESIPVTFSLPETDETENSLSLELVSFNPKKVMIYGTELHGELRETNTGKEPLCFQLYDIEYDDGYSDPSGIISPMPSEAYDLGPGESCLLPFTVTIRPWDMINGYIARSFTLIEKTLSDDPESVTSNTVRASIPLPGDTWNALKLELLSFDAVPGMTEGTVLHGELRATNTGDDPLKVLLVLTTDANGDSSKTDFVGPFPPKSNNLAPNESFTMLFSVTVNKTDVSAGYVTRHFILGAETLTEKPELVYSNMVKGSLDFIAAENSLLLELIDLDPQPGMKSGTELHGELRATNTGDENLTIDYGVSANEDGYIAVQDVFGPYPSDSVDMAPNASCVIPISVTVTSPDVSAEKVLREFTLSAHTETDHSESLLSNSVTAELPFPKDESKPAAEDFCVRTAVELREDGAVYTQYCCAEHAPAREAVTQAEAARTPEAWRNARELWKAETDEMYEALIAKTGDAAEEERARFETWLSRREALLGVLYPDAPEEVDREIALICMDRCVEICYELHAAPGERADDASALALTESNGAAPAFCGFEFIGADGITGRFCGRHAEIFRMAYAVLANAKDPAEGWRQTAMLWKMELGNVPRTLESETGAFEDWLDARRAVLELLYPEDSVTVERLTAETLMRHAAGLCRYE